MTPWKVFSVLTLLCSVLVIEGCRPSTNLPAKSSPEYNELVRTFYIGLAALEVGHDVQADAKLSQFTQLAQAEPAGWANWGLLALRQRNYEIAAERLQRARDLAPQNSDVRYLIGLLESSRGNNTEAIKELRKAVELDQSNLIATYKLAEEVERQGDENSAKEFQELIQQILVAQPDNLAAQVELSRVAAKRGEVETLKSTLSKIKARSSSWPPEIKERLVAIEESVASGEMNAAATRTSFLKNVLVQLPEYRQTLAAF
jgi:tetratricopeptide (TPR) repeat protein